jgi:hypothetical protein
MNLKEMDGAITTTTTTTSILSMLKEASVWKRPKSALLSAVVDI